jgi:hypothetical protein
MSNHQNSGVFPGLGFIPSIMGTVTQTLGTVTAVLSEHKDTILGALEPVKEAIVGALQPVKDFLVGLLAGMAGTAASGGGLSAMMSGAHEIMNENLDMGKVDEAIEAGEEAGEPLLERCRRVFDAIDSDGDGVLDRKELKAAMHSKALRNKFLHNDVLMSPMMFRKFFMSMVSFATHAS